MPTVANWRPTFGIKCCVAKHDSLGLSCFHAVATAYSCIPGLQYNYCMAILWNCISLPFKLPIALIAMMGGCTVDIVICALNYSTLCACGTMRPRGQCYYHPMYQNRVGEEAQCGACCDVCGVLCCAEVTEDAKAYSLCPHCWDHGGDFVDPKTIQSLTQAQKDYRAGEP